MSVVIGGWSLSLSFLLPCPPLVPLLGRRSISLWPSISQHLMVSDPHCKVSVCAWGGWEPIAVLFDHDMSNFKIDRPKYTNKHADGQTRGRVPYPAGCGSSRCPQCSVNKDYNRLSHWSEMKGVKSSTWQSLWNLITVFVSLITVTQSVLWDASTQGWITDIKSVKNVVVCCSYRFNQDHGRLKK